MTHKLAIVGVGKIARDQHIPAIAANPNFELTATASRNAEVGGVPAWRDLASLLDAKPEINCVSLCTPPQVRYSDARLALEAGRHVMLEKPPGATLSEVHDLVRIAKERELTLFATWHSRHAAAVAHARNWLRGKKILRLAISWKEDVRQWHPGQEWIWEAGGLGIFDPGINALSVMTEILPQSVHLKQAELFFPSNRQTPIAAQLEFHDPCEAEISAELDWREQGPPAWNIEVETTVGTAKLSEGGAKMEIDGTETAVGHDAEYPGLYARFADLLDSGESDVDLKPMLHVSDAFTLGKRVTVEPFDW
ncbi:Gfo/Idh/MocA family protein [Amaricoccus tamworthensis]|uniref:Gfo/Idh/MocA family protein n=1 Tax=Amaricoccus tamworthensis TaxID=57002 RepID=UPI003C79CE71